MVKKSNRKQDIGTVSGNCQLPVATGGCVLFASRPPCQSMPLDQWGCKNGGLIARVLLRHSLLLTLCCSHSIQAVDAFFTAVDERLQASLPEFESEVLRTVLRIPAHVVVGSELAAAADGFGAVSSGATAVLTPAQVEEEAAVERELVQLQQRVARAAKLNRALRTERTSPPSLLHQHSLPRRNTGLCCWRSRGGCTACLLRSCALSSANILVAPLLLLSPLGAAR